MTTQLWLLAGALLLCTGLTLIITSKNTVVMLFGVELMLNASNLNLVYFDKLHPGNQGQLFTLFIIIIAVCETAVGLALVFRVFRVLQTSDASNLTNLKDS